MAFEYIPKPTKSEKKPYKLKQRGKVANEWDRTIGIVILRKTAGSANAILSLLIGVRTMPGTKTGGAKARDTNIKLYGKDYYRKISSKGGSAKGVNKGWYQDKARAKAAGAKGGAKRWEGRLGIQQAHLLAYIALSPIVAGQGNLERWRNFGVLETLKKRQMVVEREGLWYVSKLGEDYLMNHELTNTVIEAPKTSFLAVSGPRFFNFGYWFPFGLTLSLLYASYTVIHYYLILGTLWAR